MSKKNKRDTRGRPSKAYTREDIERAMKFTKSCRAAARYLHCNYYTFRDYARKYKDPETGQTLFDKHKNQFNKGITKHGSRIKRNPTYKIPMEEIFNGGVVPHNFSIPHFKRRLIDEHYFEECCSRCGFNEKRELDYKVPLILAFKDKNKKNFSLENLDILCYNCYFLYIGNVFNNRELRQMEDYTRSVSDSKIQENFELDKYQIKRLKELGLWNETTEPGAELIEETKPDLDEIIIVDEEDFEGQDFQDWSLS